MTRPDAAALGLLVGFALALAGAAAGLVLAVLVAQAAPAWRYRAVRVVDGDTVQIGELSDAQELYWADRGRESVRLLCVAAPELREAGGPAARAALAARLAPGARVELEADAGERRDAFGRLLAFARLDGADLGIELVRAGLARVDRRCSRLDYAAAERAARLAGAGLWAPVE